VTTSFTTAAALTAAVVVFAAFPTPIVGQDRSTDQTIRFHQSRIAADPDDPLAHNRLAAAYVQKARESGDLSYYALAEKAATRSLALLPRGHSAAVAAALLAAVHLARHEFTDALGRARQASQSDPAEPTPYAIAGDALVELGEYEQAAQAYARIAGLDGPQGADSRLAYLKFLKGDTRGAIASMQRAVTLVSSSSPRGEPAAWARAQLGDFYFQVGDLAAAERALTGALTAAPGYHRAQAGLARVRAAQGRDREAVELYGRALAVIPLPEYAAALGDVHARAGRTAEANRQYDLVEYIGRLSALNQTVYNRELALFYADHGRRLPEALDLARRELDVRRDVYTWDVLAWTLHQNGRAGEAGAAMADALKLGTRDPRLLFHAGMIHKALGDTDRARDYLGQALALNPRFHPLQADVASRALTELTRGAAAPVRRP
jgi:tetratricopeptide (TPR) repeat protein